MATKTRVPATRAPKPATREELEQRRNGKLVRAPSGTHYRIRQLNLERHALSGGLPADLIKVALGGAEEIGRLFAQMASTDGEEEPEVAASRASTREYLDEIVLAQLVEPKLTHADLGDPTDLKADSLLPGIDYQWLVSVAFREVDHDADDVRIWGVEPLSRFPEVPDQPGILARDESGV